jgi:mannose-6-phosphate isomerase-like protein (cupin superfamily)
MVSERPYEVVHVDELDRIPVGEHGLLWRPVRRRLGIEAFGVNAYTAEEAGQEVVEHHDETGTGAGQHQELYVVVRGRATFTLDEAKVEAPAGTFVFVRERAVRRGARAEEPGTTVLALGGKPGEAFQVSPWEYYFAAIPAFRDKDYPRGIEIVREGLDRYPDNPHVLYTLACLESLNGNADSALDHLRQSVVGEPRIAKWAETDTDLDPIRDDPRFASAVAGKPDAGDEAA